MGEPLIYLASASPRRQALLDQLGLVYGLVRVDVGEDIQVGEQPEQFVLRLALAKARAGRQRLLRGGIKGVPENAVVLGADTAVVVDDRILGKPGNTEDAMGMLALLSGRSHMAMTGVAVVAGKEATRVSVTRVFFRETSLEERATYCATGEAFDKAGAYGIQGRAAIFISRIEGSYSGVVGLPLCETADLLREFGIAVLSDRAKG